MFPKLTPATRAIILVNILVYLLEKAARQSILVHFALWPLAASEGLFRPWQLVTYAFLHDPGNILHIFFNMFALYMFGPALEQHWGGRRFLGYYFVCVIAAGATQLAVEYAAGTGEPTLGASGGIFGILLAFAVLFPRARLLLLLPPIPMPAWLFVTLYGVLELFFGVTGTQASVAHFAHLGGMLGGALVLLYWRLRTGRGGSGGGWRPA
ncbi:MAG: rhomboid family intramembrane serine protease [Gammaproteobacteria bacterium]|nr:rhomboid family intramembrane serine protease [Gammaproteobacteria bacterium]MDE2263955.1 rhomboid family intramembrane serine protease [Gammaproteobacteria bacterium]